MKRSALCAIALPFLVASALAQDSGTPVPNSEQANTRAVTGFVGDPSGARLLGATVHVEGRSGRALDVLTDDQGRFTLQLTPGTYHLFITAPGFEPFVRDPFSVSNNRTQKSLNVTMHIAAANEVVNVGSDSEDTSAGANGGALVFKDKQLQALSDNDATLQKQLLAMAGGDGQHAPQLYIDGFTGGQMPPKSAIREVRINQNPFSAEYDGLGFGRIEVFTKPGSDKLHGYLQVQGNHDSFNAPNPFVPNQPPYYSDFIGGDLSGALGKKTSFFLSSNRNDQENNAVVNAVIVDPGSFLPVPDAEAISNPSISYYGSARLDRQITANNTFTSRYEYSENNLRNGGVSLLTLPTEAFNSDTVTQTLQLGDTQIIGAHKTNELRFQYIRSRTLQNAQNGTPTLVVQGSFNGGGAPTQNFSDKGDRYEFQDYFGLEHGKHFFRTGARYRLFRDSNVSTANYNGQYTFPDLATYQKTLSGIAAGLTPQQIRAEGGGATQFSITEGQPGAAILTGDLGVYAEDEWKTTKNLTLDLGFRFETQSAVYDHSDPAYRLGFAWAVHQAEKKPAWFVLRGGAGVFYQRIDAGNLLTTVRQNGVSQLAFIQKNPDTYPSVPSVGALPAVQPTIYRLDPHQRSNYDLIESLSVDRSLGKYGSISLNWFNERGVHALLSTNANAPLPGTYTGAANSGVRPLGDSNIYQYTSGGLSRGNDLFTNWNLQPIKSISIWGFYGVFYNNSDSAGAGTFASNSYRIADDYSRASFNVRQRLFTGADITLPYRFSLSPFLAYSSGQPFNITTGSDNNGDTIYNDRPAFATDLSRASVMRTRYGDFDLAPLPGQTIIPANYGVGPQFVSLQVSLSKSVKFGPPPAPGAESAAPPPAAGPVKKGSAPKPDPPYELGFSVEGDNVLNHVNGAVPIGVLTSPYFGRSIDLNSFFSAGTQANRTVTLRSYFRF